ncbi:chC2 zinc finger protein [Caudoviricetes sp.]|nr:chC2 zinc finger protein [Caudoviricetes sp.]
MRLHKEERIKKLTLSEALDLFCPTYEDLEELKQTMIENMTEEVQRIKREQHICGNQDDFDAWYRKEFGIGRKRMTDDHFIAFMEVRKDVQILMIERATEEPKRVVKRIIQIQQRILNPSKKQGGVTDIEIERAREYPLEDLIGTRIFKATGKWRANTHCPLAGHAGEKTPSFYIDKSNHYKCFGCGGHGDSISFVMQRDGLNFIQAVKSLNQ